MKYRKLGKTGLDTSVIGMGTDQFYGEWGQNYSQNVIDKIVDKAQEELTLIAGQKAIKTKAKKAIAGFKIRAGMPLGVSVTLRNKIMYEFLDRLVNIAIPRIRDFRGINPKSFDGYGNYSFGLKEQVIFPEINLDQIKRFQGMNIVIEIESFSDEESKELLRLFGVPFRK